MADVELEGLVGMVKDLQRRSLNAREQWGFYCDAHGQGFRDPSKHDAEYIKKFLWQYDEGVTFGEPAAPSALSANMADLFKEGQRKSAAWKHVWATYCQHYGGGLNDPAKHDPSFLVSFLDFVGEKAVMAQTLDHGPPSLYDPRAIPQVKRVRAGPVIGLGQSLSVGGRPPYPSQPLPTGDPLRESLIQRIKTFQRSSPSAKETWWAYCDAQLEGVRDPARHEGDVLQCFAMSHGVP
eukprot:TRINITY_DN24703_c0_g1_i1.p1 TRINITY_DN24703_c0_g1~~TRINITY_DN24703_c0_g1_i1.p1  ORF type:complete len:237 (-),score=36.29 TRINITY_DN24703_c0_g1_i1:121-831(-)